MMQLSLASLSIRLDAERWTISTAQERLLFGNACGLLRPVIDDAPADVKCIGVTQPSPRQVVMELAAAGLEGYRVEFRASDDDDALDIRCQFRVNRACQMNRLEVLPRGTVLNLYDVVNPRNRQHTPAVWPELPLGAKQCITDTTSRDWQFAPHPTMLLLRKNDLSLLLACMDLPTSFGMHFDAASHVLNNCYLDYGDAPFGLPLAAGQSFASPWIRLFLRQNRSPMEMWRELGEMLIRSGRIPDPAARKREAWWQEPLYCTWVDQSFEHDTLPPADLKEQAAATQSPKTRFSEDLVRRAVRVIKREKLPIRTILLDDGWDTTRGQWEPHPQRLPHFRKLVDELHEQGFKVVVWWNWAEVANDAIVDASHLMAGGKLNRHGQRMRDYSMPATQQQYLKPLFRKLFSSEEGCYDLDGVKTDFLADKVHPEMPVHDPSWRGEENYFVHVTRLFYQEMKRHKPDAVHIGCAGDYWLSPWIDINRTYDVWTSNWREHEQRGRLMTATCPGVPVAYDFHIVLENLDAWLKSAKDEGASVQIGNLLRTKADWFTPPQDAQPDYYRVLRERLT